MLKNLLFFGLTILIIQSLFTIYSNFSQSLRAFSIYNNSLEELSSTNFSNSTYIYLLYRFGGRSVALHPLLLYLNYGENTSSYNVSSGVTFLGLDPGSKLYGIGYTMVNISRVYVNTPLWFFSKPSDIHFTAILMRYSGYGVFRPGYIEYEDSVEGINAFAPGRTFTKGDVGGIDSITQYILVYKPIVYLSSNQRYTLDASYIIAVSYKRSSYGWNIELHLEVLKLGNYLDLKLIKKGRQYYLILDIRGF